MDMNYNAYSALRKEKAELEKRLNEYKSLQRALHQSKNRLSREENSSALKKVFHEIWFPFSMDAIITVFSTALGLLATIIMAGAVPFVVIAGLFCIAVNIVWLSIYVVLSPFFAIFVAASKSKRVRKCKANYELLIHKVEKFNAAGLNASIEQCDRQIYTIERVNPTFSDKYEGKSLVITDSVKETQFYKDAYDKHLREYTGYPPKDEKSHFLITQQM
ncbi:MAG: hypothetical protein IJX51_05705 [Clostridia bacterium]|nr:hypothetical protein [Clostridia bacterium]